MILDAETFHSWHLLAGERGKPVVWFSLKVRTRSNSVWGQEKVDVPIQAKRANSPVLHRVLFRPSANWVTHTSVRTTFTQSTGSDANPLEMPSQLHPEVMFYQFSGHPLTQVSWHIKLAIPPCDMSSDTSGFQSRLWQKQVLGYFLSSRTQQLWHDKVLVITEILV